MYVYVCECMWVCVWECVCECVSLCECLCESVYVSVCVWMSLQESEQGLKVDTLPNQQKNIFLRFNF